MRSDMRSGRRRRPSRAPPQLLAIEMMAPSAPAERSDASRAAGDTSALSGSRVASRASGSDWKGTSRYQVIRVLGHGGMGVV